MNYIRNALEHIRFSENELMEMKEVLEQPTEELKTEMFIMLKEFVSERIDESRKRLLISQKKREDEEQKKHHKSTVQITEID